MGSSLNYILGFGTGWFIRGDVMAPKKKSKKSNASPKRAKPVTTKKSSVKRTTKKSVVKTPVIKKEVGFFIKNIENFEHSIDFDVVRGLFAAAIFMVVSQLIEMLTRNTTNLFYADPAYVHMWSDLIVSESSLLPFSIYTIIASFFVGFLYAFFYHMVRVSLHGHAPHQPWVKGLLFGIFLVFVVAIPMAIQNFMTLNLPLGLIITWFAKDILVYLIGGTAIATIIK